MAVSSMSRACSSCCSAPAALRVPSLAQLLLFLSLAVSAATEGGSSRFLAQAGKSIGQQCGSSGYGYQLGGCADGLRCVPPPAGSPPGSPSICRKQCGYFDAEGDHVDESVDCGLARECSGMAAVSTPCQGESDGAACYMYCAYSSREGEKCGISPTSGDDYGACGPGYACVAPAAGGASTCQKAPSPAPSPAGRRLKMAGQQCGTTYYGYSYGGCGDGLRCVPPPAGSPLGSPSTCKKQCGYFDAEGKHVDESVDCGLARECSGMAAVSTPCQGESDDACYMYCAYSSREGEECGVSPTSGDDYGQCGPGYACVKPSAGSPPGAASTCQKAGKR